MKYLLAILLSIASCQAQPFTFNDLAFIGQHTDTTSFSPADVANLVMWYKADAITGKSAGDLVTNWVDSSSSGYTLQNGAENQQPYYTNNASEIGNKPYLKFDGSNDRLLHFNTTVYSQPNTIFLLCKILTPSTALIFVDGTNANTRNAITYRQSATGWSIYAGTEVDGGANTARTNQWTLFEATFNGASSSLTTNGVSYLSGVNANTQPLSGLTVGCRYALTTLFHNGGIAEIIIYNSNVSAGDRTAIRTYFTDKYGSYASW